MVKNKLLEKKGKQLPERGRMSQIETSVSVCICMCIYYLLSVSAVFSEFHTNFTSYGMKGLLKNEYFPGRILREELEVY